MTIQIELTPEEGARLRERAAARGPESLAGQMLRSLLHLAADRGERNWQPVLDEHGVFHRDRWEAVLASIERRSRGTPVLPPEALTREAMYQDHD